MSIIRALTGDPARLRRRWAPVTAVVAALSTLTPSAPLAQPVLGAALPSAYVPPALALRLGADQDWADWDATFGSPAGGSARRSLGAGLSGDTPGSIVFPSLVALRGPFSVLTGGGTLSLGRTTVDATARSRTTNFDVEAGLGKGLSLRLDVPIVQRFSVVGVGIDPTTATAGLNPARSNATAAATDARVVQQLTNAVGALQTARADCFGGAGASDCATVRALAALATSYGHALSEVYGTAQGGGGVVVPVAGSKAAGVVDSALKSLDQRFSVYLNADSITARPVAGIPLTGTDVAAAFADTAFGAARDTLKPREQLGLGNVALTVRLRFLDTFGGDERRRVASSGIGVRATAEVSGRLGATSGEDPSDPLGVGVGDRRSGVEAGLTTDVLLGRRLWVTVAAHQGRLLARSESLLLPLGSTDVGPPVASRQLITHEGATTTTLEVAPRVSLASTFGVAGYYALRERGADRYSGAFALATGGATLDASILDAVGASQAQTLGATLTYSTVAPRLRGNGALPFEASLGYFYVIAGQHGVPATTTTRLSLRFYPGVSR